MNPIYIDSESDDDDDDDADFAEKAKSNVTQKSKQSKNTTGEKKTNIIVKKYLYDDDSKSPLAPTKTKNNETKDNKKCPLVSNTQSNASSPLKINLDDIESSYQLAMKNLNESIEKAAKERSKYSLTPVKNATTSSSKFLETTPKKDSNISTDSFDDMVNQTQRYKEKQTKSVNAKDETTEVDCIKETKKESKILDNIEASEVKQSTQREDKTEVKTENETKLILHCKDEPVVDNAKKNRKSDVSVVFEHGLNEYLCELSQSHHFKTNNNEVSHRLAIENL